VTAEPGRLPPELVAAMHRLDELIEVFGQHPDQSVQDAFFETLRAVDVVHRSGLQRLDALLAERSLRDEAGKDPQVALLFDLYAAQEEHLDERSRAEAAVAAIRPYVESHGGRLEVVSAEDGVISIRLLGACESCSGSTATLRALVEEALRAELPEFVRMDVAPPAHAPAPKAAPVLIPVSSLTQTGQANRSHGGCGGGCGSGRHACSSCG
jgi:Fe-S cluster biogenesis protein NfuA